ncbi:MAG TPA: cold shock domain-containing protein [Anaerolineae bacterium]
MDNRLRGTVRWFDGSKGYGYIQPEKGAEVFVHYTAIADKGMKMLSPGQRVEFTVTESYRGPLALDVVRV